MNQRNASTGRGPAPEAEGRLTDHAFERLVDAHADGQISAQARRVLEQELARSTERRAAFERSERLLIAMREPVRSPDFSAAILERLEDRGVILPSRKRRVMFLTRAVVAAGLAIATVTLVLVERRAPGTTPMASAAPAPVSSVVEASRDAVDTSASQVRQAVRTLQSELLPPAPAPIAVADTGRKPLGLKLGSTASHDGTMRWTVDPQPVRTAVLPSRQESAISALLAEPDDRGLWLGMQIPDDGFWPGMLPKIPANPAANHAKGASGTAPGR